MNRNLTIVTMVLRVCYIAIIILGILLWTGNFDNLSGIHILIGIVIVLGLWALGIIQVVRGGSPVLAGICFVVGAAQLFVGLFQEKWLEDSPNHWIIQVLHALLGLAVIGVTEATAARAKRLAAGNKTSLT